MASAATADDAFDAALDRMASGDPQAAISLLQQVLTIAPDHPAASHALMRALEDSGELEAALALCRELIAADPDDALLHTRLSILLQRTGDIPAAEGASARAKILAWKAELRGTA